MGETPNLAARLQALAEPGSVVIAEFSRRLLGEMFELKSLGVLTLRGFDTPTPAWTVLREVQNVSRFEASRSRGVTPFVGREHEVALLLDRWRKVEEGKGQVVLLSGEAGIGKSRILAVLSDRISNAPHVRVRYQCSPHRINDAFHPISNQIWHAAGIASDEPAAAKLDKLEAMIAESGLEGKEIAPLIASLLSIPSEKRYPELDLAPTDRKEQTIAALLALFDGLAKELPVLVLLEDAHWIDPTSLDVFGRLVHRLPSRRALLAVTFRPEFAAPWVGRAHVASLTLSRFGRPEAMEMVDRIAGGKALPAEVLEQIVAKTDGVPLFVEELTKSVLKFGAVARGRWRLPPQPVSEPARDSLNPAGLVDGAPGSARASKGDRADWRDDRARVLISTIGSGLAGPGARVTGCARPAHGGRVDPRARHPARGDLHLQACSGSGYGIRIVAA